MFKYESQFIRRMTKVTDYLLVNVLFIVTSAPIITIGVTIPAALAVIRKLAMDQQPAVIHSYIAELKNNFRQGFFFSGILALSWSFLVLNLAFVSSSPLINSLINLGCIWLLALIVFINCFILPYTARYRDSLKNSIWQSLAILRANFRYFLGELVVTIVLLVLAVSSPVRLLGAVFFLTFGGSTFFLYVIYRVTNTIFAKYEK